MPRTFVISWINFFDNRLESRKVTANNELEALVLALRFCTGAEDWSYTEFKDAEAVKCKAFDCDSMVNALEI